MSKTASGPREVLAGWREAAARHRAAVDDAKQGRKLALQARNAHIRELVDVEGLSQRDVASAYGLSQPQVIRILATG